MKKKFLSAWAAAGVLIVTPSMSLAQSFLPPLKLYIAPPIPGTRLLKADIYPSYIESTAIDPLGEILTLRCGYKWVPSSNAPIFDASYNQLISRSDRDNLGRLIENIGGRILTIKMRSSLDIDKADIEAMDRSGHTAAKNCLYDVNIGIARACTPLSPYDTRETLLSNETRVKGYCEDFYQKVKTTITSRDFSPEKTENYLKGRLINYTLVMGP